MPAALFHVRKADSTYNSENTYAIKISDGNDSRCNAWTFTWG